MNEIIMSVTEKIKELLKDADVWHEVVTKNNDCEFNAIAIRQNEKKSTPIIYIDSLLSDYSSGKISVDNIAKTIVGVYESVPKEIGGSITDYDMISGHLNLRLVNREMNRKLLKDIPYKAVLDFAVYAVVEWNSEAGESAAMKVNETCLNIWDHSFEEVYARAVQNFEKEETVIDNLGSMLSEIMKKSGFEGELKTGVPMYILTNRNRIYGAARLLDTNALEEFAGRVNGDLIILPSSIHEVILIPASHFKDGPADDRELKKIVEEVNREEVRSDEVLSNDVYIYKKGLGLRILTP